MEPRALVVLTFVVFYIPDFLDDQRPARRRARCSPRSRARPITVGAVHSGATTRRCRRYRNAYGGQMNDQLIKQLGIDRQILQPAG